MRIKTKTVSKIILGILFFVYGTFSSPWPRTIQLAEVFIGISLISLVGFKGGFVGLGAGKNKRQIPWIISFVFIYFLTVPLFTGLWYGWSLVDIFRDMIPLIYMFIPLLLYFFYKNRILWREKISMMIGLVGFLFSVRFLLDIPGIWSNKLYLPSAPSVLFGGVFWLLLGLGNKSKKIMTWVYFAMGIACFVAALFFSQRAVVGLITISALVIVFLFKRARKNLMILILVLTMILLLSLYLPNGGLDVLTILESNFANLVYKMQAVGLNNKGSEFINIIEVIAKQNMLFGLGWGAVVKLPTASVPISFTHSWLSYTLLKSGILGLVFLVIYIYWLIPKKITSLFFYKKKNYSLLASLLASLSVVFHGILFQPTYKTLDFGFVLLILALCKTQKVLKKNV